MASSNIEEQKKVMMMRTSVPHQERALINGMLIVAENGKIILEKSLEKMMEEAQEQARSWQQPERPYDAP